jgi:glycosyltransferase involved in cell wall biosynthesis
MASTISPVSMTDQRRKELRGSYGIADSDVVIAYFGLLHSNKGIEPLLETFAFVHLHLAAARLLMLSLFEPSSNPYHAKLQAATAALKIESAVVWAGYLDNDAVSEHLSISDIGFFPYQDGVTLRRLSFMTAMSHGLATVTTAGHAGTKEIGLRDGENVLLVDATASIDAVARRLLSLAADPGLRGRLSRGAKEWAAPFQWSTIVARTFAIYTSLRGTGSMAEHAGR